MLKEVSANVHHDETFLGLGLISLPKAFLRVDDLLEADGDHADWNCVFVRRRKGEYLISVTRDRSRRPVRRNGRNTIEDVEIELDRKRSRRA